jgi:hypothetical protein
MDTITVKVDGNSKPRNRFGNRIWASQSSADNGQPCYGDLFPVVPNVENRNNFAALNSRPWLRGPATIRIG